MFGLRNRVHSNSEQVEFKVIEELKPTYVFALSDPKHGYEYHVVGYDQWDQFDSLIKLFVREFAAKVVKKFDGPDCRIADLRIGDLEIVLVLGDFEDAFFYTHQRTNSNLMQTDRIAFEFNRLLLISGKWHGPNWSRKLGGNSKVIKGNQFAVFFTNPESGVLLSSNGTWATTADEAFLIFTLKQEAVSYAKRCHEIHPEICASVSDHKFEIVEEFSDAEYSAAFWKQEAAASRNPSLLDRLRRTLGGGD